MGVYSRLCELLMVDGTLKVLASTEPQPKGPCQKEDGTNKEEQKEEREDFAEVVSTYIISTDAQWNAILKKATVVDANGAAAGKARRAYPMPAQSGEPRMTGRVGSLASARLGHRV